MLACYVVCLHPMADDGEPIPPGLMLKVKAKLMFLQCWDASGLGLAVVVASWG